MTRHADPSVTVFVDPQCPFAWITAQWLLEVARHTGLAVDVALMSLSCVNEGRDLDEWYRQYNEDAWAAARVAAALLDGEHAAMWPRFYQTYGYRRHVDGLRDNPTNLATTIADLAMPADLLDAAGDSCWDDELRRRTAAALAGRTDGGTPMLHAHDRAFFGPVLTQIPRGPAAVDLWNAVDTLAAAHGFSAITTERSDELHTD
jgi:2-hydroxychromene-2-carboxylate isomerase